VGPEAKKVNGSNISCGISGLPLPRNAQSRLNFIFFNEKKTALGPKLGFCRFVLQSKFDVGFVFSALCGAFELLYQETPKKRDKIK
jgi:hypothetical protein